MRRPVPLLVALLVLIPAIASPMAMAVFLVATDEEPEEFAFPTPAVPSVDEGDLEAYDVASLVPGQWVEYEIVSASQMTDSSRVRTRLSCVGLEGDTVWIEQVDYLLARLYPGTVLLCSVDRTSGRILRAWWGRPGGAGVEVRVRPRPSGGPVATTSRWGDATPETILHARGELSCELVRVLERPDYLPGMSSRTMTWMCAEVPFRRRSIQGAGDGDIRWEHPRTIQGGVAREYFSGLTVRMATKVVAWGADARPTLDVKIPDRPPEPR
ncbi:MAG: hypothetical protein HYY18_16350 [Planctomycetes bacterium]|nr:hypothetical protein [Planctomycetota bacterium]